VTSPKQQGGFFHNGQKDSQFQGFGGLLIKLGGDRDRDDRNSKD